MPTYEYRCPSCQHEFEKLQRITDDSMAECPVCGKEATRRLSGGAGLLFKGSGFYITDYRSDSYKKAAGAEGGSPSKGSADTPKGGGDKPSSTGDSSSPSTSSGKKDS